MATLDIDNPRHPLFLQPSDNPSNVIISIQLKGTKNYLVWSKVMVMALRAKRKLGFIDGTCTKCQFTEEKIGNLITGIVYADNALEVWLDLEDRFNKINKNFSVLMGLNESHGAIRSQILFQSPSPSVRRAFAILINEENQWKVCFSNSQVNLASDMNDSTAFMSTKDSLAKFKKFNNLYCEYCRFNGHTKDTCYKLHGYPPSFKGKRNYQYRQANAVVNDDSHE
ncbi:uncharacterized protein LOC142162756 [Nicotiana tabacum]|uniref:Uncharacterized protein LOC142162756 n=1 Tax=Nicotiana tabacum TaxID=4097 RepID=A0AC58RS66_TOBAC